MNMLMLLGDPGGHRGGQKEALRGPEARQVGQTGQTNRAGHAALGRDALLLGLPGSLSGLGGRNACLLGLPGGLRGLGCNIITSVCG